MSVFRGDFIHLRAISACARISWARGSGSSSAPPPLPPASAAITSPSLSFCVLGQGFLRNYHLSSHSVVESLSSHLPCPDTVLKLSESFEDPVSGPVPEVLGRSDRRLKSSPSGATKGRPVVFAAWQCPVVQRRSSCSWARQEWREARCSRRRHRRRPPLLRACQL